MANILKGAVGKNANVYIDTAGNTTTITINNLAYDEAIEVLDLEGNFRIRGANFRVVSTYLYGPHGSFFNLGSSRTLNAKLIEQARLEKNTDLLKSNIIDGSGTSEFYEDISRGDLSDYNYSIRIETNDDIVEKQIREYIDGTKKDREDTEATRLSGEGMIIDHAENKYIHDLNQKNFYRKNLRNFLVQTIIDRKRKIRDKWRAINRKKQN
jgi:hypothetical protein